MINEAGAGNVHVLVILPTPNVSAKNSPDCSAPTAISVLLASSEIQRHTPFTCILALFLLFA